MNAKHALRLICDDCLGRRARRLDPAALAGPALVVAPHPDDETLGCGGTIILHRMLGSEVTIAVCTDGAASHPVLAPDVLAAVRRDEAAGAAAALGVPAGGLVHLDLPDGRLAEHESAAAAQLAVLIEARRPVRLFVPSRHEPPADHRAARAAALRALASVGGDVEVFEYPVWAWEHWPWAPGGAGRVAAAGRAGAGFARLLRDLNVAVPVANVLGPKRRALDAHASQMRRPDGAADWPTLPEVWDGAFLGRFFGPFEMFRRWRPRPADQRRAA